MTDDRGVLTLTLDCPETRNAVGVDELERIDAELSADEARVVVLTGAGLVFCSGADRRVIGDDRAVADLTAALEAVIARIEDLPVPVVCRVNGPAVGAGMALVGAADLVITADTAVFAFPEVRFGMVATVAARVCAPRLGSLAALDLLLTGRSFGAHEAHRVGLVSAVTPLAGLDPAVEDRVADLLLGDPAALAETKASTRRLTRINREGR